MLCSKGTRKLAKLVYDETTVEKLHSASPSYLNYIIISKSIKGRKDVYEIIKLVSF